jgi:hypothetical protein
VEEFSDDSAQELNKQFFASAQKRGGGYNMIDYIGLFYGELNDMVVCLKKQRRADEYKRKPAHVALH